MNESGIQLAQTTPAAPVNTYIAVAFGQNIFLWWEEVKRLNPAGEYIFLQVTDSESVKSFTLEQLAEKLGLKP